jgi:hypothetical protein
MDLGSERRQSIDANDLPAVAPKELTELDHLRTELARADALYAVSLRDYFATFGIYASATSILLATLGFVLSRLGSSWVPGLLAFAGLFLCLQWHISTTSMRDQYRHFYYRIVMLERDLGLAVMLRWHDAANYSRGRQTLLGNARAAHDAAHLSWSFTLITRPWGMRASSLPIIYSSVFLYFCLSLSGTRGTSNTDKVAVAAALIWLVVGNVLVYWESRGARNGRKVRAISA